jgi:GDP-L-fucose synthase
MNLADEPLNATVSPMCSHLNVGAGIDLSIKELVDLIVVTVGYRGRIRYWIDKPEGTPRKLLNVSQLNRLGWTSAISFKEGLAETYRWYDNLIDSEPG